MINPIAQALMNITPGAQWTLRGETYADLDWVDEVIPKPTEAEVEAGIADLPNKQVQAESAQKAQEEARESALSKLTLLGLTQDEIKALVG